MPEMLKEVLHVNYTFIKLTLVKDGKKELLFAESAVQLLHMLILGD